MAKLVGEQQINLAASPAFWPTTSHSPGAGGYDAACTSAMGIDGSAGWPAANRAILIPFFNSHPILVQGIAWVTASAAGNADVGICDLTGKVLANAGSQVLAGATAIQIGAFTIELAPGTYYMVMVCSSTSAIIQNVQTSLQMLIPSGIQQSAAAIPLTGTLTLANPASTIIPVLTLMANSVA